MTKAKNNAKGAKSAKANETKNAAKQVKTVEAVEAVEVEAVEVESVPVALPAVKETESGKVSSKEVLKAAGSLRASIREERRGANCTIRLIAERAAAGDAAAVNILCALCDVPRDMLYSLNIDIVRAAVKSYYPYYIETDGRKVSVKPVGVWYSTAASDEAIEDAAKRVRRGYVAAPVADYLDQLIRAAKCRAKGIKSRCVEADAVYSNIELSEAAGGVTAKDITDAKERRAYAHNAINVWHKDRSGFYI